MFKKSLFLSLMALSLQSFGGLKQTTLSTLVPPSSSDLKQSIRLIREAIDAQERGKVEVVKLKLSKARALQELRSSTIVFKAAFILRLGSKKINYFQELQEDSETLFKGRIDDTCFVGKASEANRILSHKIESLNYDEEWFERNRVLNENELYIDLVDGPNDARETHLIERCKR